LLKIFGDPPKKIRDETAEKSPDEGWSPHQGTPASPRHRAYQPLVGVVDSLPYAAGEGMLEKSSTRERGAVAVSHPSARLTHLKPSGNGGLLDCGCFRD